MNNLDELTSRIEKLIKCEKATNPDIKYLNESHAKLISQIISNYELKHNTENRPNAQMIFLGAPTGAGKDTVVKKICSDNEDKKFVTLNMDMFRHYHSEIVGNQEGVKDKNFAKATNQTSYELYYMIQEAILKEFPGTNVIVTGTLRDLEWIKEIASRYKNDLKTNYTTSLATLAVPINESAFSIFERYLNMVNTRDSSNDILRYTDLDYHNDTVKKFLSNIRTLEIDFNQNTTNRLFDSIKVYRRNKDMENLSENTVIYDSDNHRPGDCAVFHIYEIMNSNSTISDIRTYKLLDIITKNADYLKSQDLYDSLLQDLSQILPQLNKKIR